MPIRFWRKDRLESCERCGAFSVRREVWQSKKETSVLTSRAHVRFPKARYCSAYCRTAGSEEVEIACECDHEACQLEANRSLLTGRLRDRIRRRSRLLRCL